MLASAPMETLSTRPSLLLRVRDVRDGGAWRTFVELYVPLLHGYFTRSGVAHHDAADLTQEVLQAVARNMPGFNYDPVRGHFRNWLRTIARNQMFKFFSRSQKLRMTDGSSAAWREAEEKVEDSAEAGRWEREYRVRVFAIVSAKVRADVSPVTWDAFWRTAVLGETADTASLATGLSAGAIYVARCRVTARLRALIAEAGENGDAK